MDNLNLKMNLGQYLSVIYVCFISININVTFYEHYTDNKKNLKSTIYFSIIYNFERAIISDKCTFAVRKRSVADVKC